MYRKTGPRPAAKPTTQVAEPREFELFAGDEFDMRIMLVGRSGSGKSSVGNTILRSKFFPERTGFAAGNKKCFVEMAVYRKIKIRVVDTCGLFDTSRPQEEIKKEAAKAFTMAAPGPHVFLLVIPVDRFTPEHQETVSILEKMFPHFFRYTIVVFTRGDVLKDMTINEAIKVADPELKKLLRDVQRRFVVFNNLEPDAGKKEETVLGLLDMVYNVYQLNEEAYFTTDQFQKAESLAASRDEEIQREAKEESKGPNADLVGILLEKISHFERKFLEQSQLMAQQNENLRTIAALAAAEKGTGAAQRYLARALNIKEVEHDKGNVPLTGLDPFALLLVAKALRTKVTDKNTSIENCQIDSQTMPQKLQN